MVKGIGLQHLCTVPINVQCNTLFLKPRRGLNNQAKMEAKLNDESPCNNVEQNKENMGTVKGNDRKIQVYLSVLTERENKTTAAETKTICFV